VNPIGLTFLSISALLMWVLPRRWAAVPLILSAAYMTSGQVLDIAGANFTVPRVLVAVGFLRAMKKGEHIAGGMQTVDRLVLAFGTLLILTSALHTSDAWLYRFGMVWTELGCYFLFRTFIQGIDDVRRIFKFIAIALLPLAALMLMEKSTGINSFGDLGGANRVALVRDGTLRAGGPFGHPILAGIVGATCIAIGLSLRKGPRLHALAGVATGTAMLYAAASSGPILMVVFVLLGRWAWIFRRHMKLVRGLLVAAILGLTAVMKAPVYFLMARVDIVGGSEGWFRAQLIDSAIDHLSEWWLAGTDYTRHWMATGISANARHTDLTNHILTMGVMGGLPLLILFVLILSTSFRNVGHGLRKRPDASVEEQRFIWALGALLLGFTAGFMSITLFDQSVIFFWLTVAAIAGIVPAPVQAPMPVEPKPGIPRTARGMELALRTNRTVVDRS
jgi:hypothetical protein